jgi:2-polyprenyl-3-methyl-5-hydroxy-6-metoxy-1,4-benzoquinol methylase
MMPKVYEEIRSVNEFLRSAAPPAKVRQFRGFSPGSAEALFLLECPGQDVTLFGRSFSAMPVFRHALNHLHQEDVMPAAVDSARLNEFMGKAVADMGAAMSASMVLIGDKLGLYKSLAQHGPMRSDELASKAGCSERYVREWLNNQAAGGYLTYEPASRKFTLPPEQAMALADESSPVFLCGAFQVIEATMKAQPRIAENFRTGKGMAWGEHDPCLFVGTERFFRPNYVGNLVSNWIPALDGVEAKLKKGARVADIGCGHGASTLLMAQAFPNSTFTGFDYHDGSIETCRKRAKAAGIEARAKFQTAGSTDFPGKDYDFVTCFDCLHDMADPIGCAKHVRQALAADGTWMIVEPFAGDKPEENHNPVGRLFYGASTMLCVPCSLAQDGPALGAQAGEAILAKTVKAGGFTRFRRATQTPFNLILEARP